MLFPGSLSRRHFPAGERRGALCALEGVVENMRCDLRMAPWEVAFVIGILHGAVLAFFSLCPFAIGESRPNSLALFAGPRNAPGAVLCFAAPAYLSTRQQRGHCLARVAKVPSSLIERDRGNAAVLPGRIVQLPEVGHDIECQCGLRCVSASVHGSPLERPCCYCTSNRGRDQENRWLGTACSVGAFP